MADAMKPQLQGDPAGLRAAAQQFREAAQRSQDAMSLVRSSKDIASAGWAGAAHDAFDTAAGATGGRVAALGRCVAAAPVLENFAAELEVLQQRWNTVMAAWRGAGGDGVSPLNLERQASASAQMTPILEEADAARARATQAIRAIAVMAEDEAQGRQDFNKGFDVTSGVLLNAQEEGGNYAASLASGAGRSFVPPSTGARLLASAGEAAKFTGWLASPTLAAYGQYQDDLSNPYYSVGERVGRMMGQSFSVGGSAVVGGLVGASAGSVVPIAGTAAGAVVGFVGGALGSYFAGEEADKRNDWIVDIAGEGGDIVGESVKDLFAW